jgi:hypothetical protein
MYIFGKTPFISSYPRLGTYYVRRTNSPQISASKNSDKIFNEINKNINTDKLFLADVKFINLSGQQLGRLK